MIPRVEAGLVRAQLSAAGLAPTKLRSRLMFLNTYRFAFKKDKSIVQIAYWPSGGGGRHSRGKPPGVARRLPCVSDRVGGLGCDRCAIRSRNRVLECRWRPSRSNLGGVRNSRRAGTASREAPKPAAACDRQGRGPGVDSRHQPPTWAGPSSASSGLMQCSKTRSLNELINSGERLRRDCHCDRLCGRQVD